MRFFLFLLLILSLTSCKKKNQATIITDTSTVIVEVGGCKLTEKMLNDALPANRTKKEALTYAREWLDLELLAQAAKEEGYSEDPQLQSTIREIERNLLAMTYLNKKMEHLKVAPNEAEILEFYKNNKELFNRQEEALDYELLVFSTAAKAWAAKKKLKAETFSSTSSRAEADSSFISTKPVPLRQFSSDLGEYLFSIKEGGIALPRNVEGRFHLYLIKRKYLAGTPMTILEARDEVVSRLSIQIKKNAEHKLKDDLRKKSNYISNEEYFKESTPQRNTEKG